MVIFVSNGPGTVPPTAEAIRKLLACEDITTYRESGWFCAIGWRPSGSDLGSDKVIGIHFGSEQEYLEATNQAPPSEYAGSYGRRP